MYKLLFINNVITNTNNNNKKDRYLKKQYFNQILILYSYTKINFKYYFHSNHKFGIINRNFKYILKLKTVHFSKKKC